MGFFDSLRDGVDRVVNAAKEGGRKEKEERERNKPTATPTQPTTTAWGHNVSRDTSGNYIYTDSKGNKITTTFAPNETMRRNAGSGLAMYHPVLQAAADSRGVGLYTAYRGDKVLSTPQHDANYISRDGGFGMDYTKRHMNPWEFSNAYGQEMAGRNVDWNQAGWAGMYSSVPDIAKNLQDMYKQMGYNYQGAELPKQPTKPQQPQMPSFQEPWPGFFNQYNPYMPMYPGWGSYNPNFGYYPYFPTTPTAPNGNGGINPGNMYGGGMQNPNPTGGYDYSGINPGGMYSGGAYTQQPNQIQQQLNQLQQQLQTQQQSSMNWDVLMPYLMPMFMGGSYGSSGASPYGGFGYGTSLYGGY